MATRPIDLFLDKLDAKGHSNGREWKARCPSPTHGGDDKNPSLSLTELNDGTVLIKCFKGCSVESICASIGLELKDLFSHNGYGNDKPRDHVYRDEAGNIVARKVRNLPNVRPRFYLEKYVGGKFVKSTGNLDLPLYFLPRVIKGVAEGKTIWICEGEKDAEHLTAAGLVATTAGSAGSWKPKYTEVLRGADVVICADRDSGGETGAAKIARALHGAAKSIKIIQSAVDNDIADHLRRGRKLTDFVNRPDLLPKWGRQVIALSTVQPIEIEWLWNPYLPKGRIVLFDGDGNEAKTYCALAIAAGITRGKLPLDGPDIDPGRVVLFASEDDADDVLLPRFLKLGGDPSMVYHDGSLFPLDNTGLKQVDETFGDLKPVLALFDPVLGYMPPGTNINDMTQVRPVFDGLKTLSRKHNCTTLNIRHTGKSIEGKKVGNFGLGSVDITNVHKSQLVVRRHPENPALRVVTHEKHNYSAQGKAFSYSFKGGIFGFDGYLDITEADFKRVPDNNLDACKDWLEAQFISAAVRLEAKEAEYMARDRGFSQSTVVRARKAVGVRSVKIGAKWFWQLDDPFEGDPPPQLPHWAGLE